MLALSILDTAFAYSIRYVAPDCRTTFDSCLQGCGSLPAFEHVKPSSSLEPIPHAPLVLSRNQMRASNAADGDVSVEECITETMKSVVYVFLGISPAPEV